jgi:hypothetical protein
MKAACPTFWAFSFSSQISNSSSSLFSPPPFESEGEKEGKANTYKTAQSLPTQEQTPAQEVEQLRAKEQAELKAAIPNADQYLTDGKVDDKKLTNDEDIEAFNKIYDKYNILITAVSSKKEAPAPKQEAPAVEALKDVESTAKALEGKDIVSVKGDVVYRGQQKGEPTGKWFTKSKEFAKIFSESLRGGKKSQNGEVIDFTLFGKVLDFPYLVTEYAKISDKLGEIFGVTRQEMVDSISKTDKELAKGETIRRHSLLENKGFQELLSRKGFDYIRAKEKLNQKEEVDTFLKISNKSQEQLIAESYHKAKKDGSNPELVKAVEDLLSPKKEAKVQETLAKAEPKLKPRVETRIKFQEVSDLSTKINEAVKGSAKRKRLIRDRNLLLEKFPIIKYVYDNIQNITKQLIKRIRINFIILNQDIIYPNSIL